MKSKTAIYARYSSHNQDDGTSIEVQLDHCRRAAGEACHEYVDRAVTGTTMSREAFDRLIADCEAGRIDTLYIYKWDRFGRSARAHAVVADLEDMGVTVISATEGRDPLGRGIQLVVAEDFSRKLSERVTEAKRRRFAEDVGTAAPPRSAIWARASVSPPTAGAKQMLSCPSSRPTCMTTSGSNRSPGS